MSAGRNLEQYSSFWVSVGELTGKVSTVFRLQSCSACGRELGMKKARFRQVERKI